MYENFKFFFWMHFRKLALQKYLRTSHVCACVCVRLPVGVSVSAMVSRGSVDRNVMTTTDTIDDILHYTSRWSINCERNYRHFKGAKNCTYFALVHTSRVIKVNVLWKVYTAAQLIQNILHILLIVRTLLKVANAKSGMRKAHIAGSRRLIIQNILIVRTFYAYSKSLTSGRNPPFQICPILLRLNSPLYDFFRKFI